MAGEPLLKLPSVISQMNVDPTKPSGQIEHPALWWEGRERGECMRCASNVSRARCEERTEGEGKSVKN